MDHESIVPLLGIPQPVSAASHLLTALLILIAAPFLLRLARGDRLRFAAFAVYILCIFLTASISGVYHCLDPDGAARAVFRRLDHASIWLAIAGSFVPPHVVFFRGFWRWGILGIVWTAAITGIVVKLAFFGLVPPGINVVFYLALGWVGVLSVGRFIKHHGVGITKLIVAGGAAFTFGALLELSNQPLALIPGHVERHELFHLFVSAGFAFHWAFNHRRVAGWEPNPGEAELC